MFKSDCDMRNIRTSYIDTDDNVVVEVSYSDGTIAEYKCKITELNIVQEKKTKSFSFSFDVEIYECALEECENRDDVVTLVADSLKKISTSELVKILKQDKRMVI